MRICAVRLCRRSLIRIGRILWHQVRCIVRFSSFYLECALLMCLFLGFIGSERASSHNSSLVFERDMDKLLNFTPSSRRNKENKNHHHSIHIQSPPGLDVTMEILRDDTANSINKRPLLAKSKSQPKVAAGSSSKSMSFAWFFFQMSFRSHFFFVLQLRSLGNVVRRYLCPNCRLSRLHLQRRLIRAAQPPRRTYNRSTASQRPSAPSRM